MHIVAHGFADEFFSDTEVVGKIPDLRVPISDGFVQLLHRDQLLDSPFVGTVFVLLAAVEVGMLIIEGTGKAVPQLVGQLAPLVGLAMDLAGVNGHEAFPIQIHNGQSLSFGKRKMIHHNILFPCHVVELLQAFHFFPFFLSRTNAA